jgi:hypothetical protein
MDRIILTFLLLAASLSVACTSPSPPDCSENLAPSIIPGRDSYALVMSSSPGLPLSPDAGTRASPSCLYQYRWQATDGTFLSWTGPDFIVHEIGNDTVTGNRTVYWTWSDPELPASGRDVLITLEVRDPEGGSALGRGALVVGWEERPL